MEKNLETIENIEEKIALRILNLILSLILSVVGFLVIIINFNWKLALGVFIIIWANNIQLKNKK
jgi:ABC-type multidrug transport system fused ATPase/permease subunit